MEKESAKLKIICSSFKMNQVVLRFPEQDDIVQQILEMIEARKTDTKSIIKESEMTQK